MSSCAVAHVQSCHQQVAQHQIERQAQYTNSKLRTAANRHSHLAGVQYEEGVGRQSSVQLPHQAIQPLQGGIQRRLQPQVSKRWPPLMTAVVSPQCEMKGVRQHNHLREPRSCLHVPPLSRHNGAAGVLSSSNTRDWSQQT